MGPVALVGANVVGDGWVGVVGMLLPGHRAALVGEGT